MVPSYGSLENSNAKRKVDNGLVMFQKGSKTLSGLGWGAIHVICWLESVCSYEAVAEEAAVILTDQHHGGEILFFHCDDRNIVFPQEYHIEASKGGGHLKFPKGLGNK